MKVAEELEMAFLPVVPQVHETVGNQKSPAEGVVVRASSDGHPVEQRLRGVEEQHRDGTGLPPRFAAWFFRVE